jgi:hypothetical protein
VYGADNSTDGGSGNVGVSGYSANGTGVWGTSTNGWGVLGQSASGFGVAAQSRGPYINAPAVVASDASGDEYQTVEAIGGTSGDSNGYNLATFLYDGTPSFWVDNNSDAYVNGLIYTRGGPCTYGCARGRGEQAGSYAAESSTPILEDDGESRLQSGQARIAIDASLARAIDQDSPYVVFVSPEGPSHGLYVTAKTATGFRVVENEGGRSTVAFSYRIMAKPYGVHAPRLPILTAARIPHAIPVRASKEFPR